MRETTPEERLIKQRNLERHFNGDNEPCSEEVIIASLTKEQDNLKEKLKICRKNKFECKQTESSENCAHFNPNICSKNKTINNCTKSYEKINSFHLIETESKCKFT